MISMHRFARAGKQWLPLAFLAGMLCLLVYGTVQQSYRQSANDPQIQMAEDDAAALTNNTPLPTGDVTGTVAIATSLSPYLVFYDDGGAPVGGNGFLNGSLPNLPQGIFSYVRAEGETRVTWQPEPGVREAIVVTRVNGNQPGFVMAGRSLREVEIREDKLGLIVLAGWLITLIGTFALELLII